MRPARASRGRLAGNALPWTTGGLVSADTLPSLMVPRASPSAQSSKGDSKPASTSATTPSVEQLSSGGFRPLSRVAYQGAPGAYSEMAALKALPGWEPMPCPQFETAFQALSQASAPALGQPGGALCPLQGPRDRGESGAPQWLLDPYRVGALGPCPFPSP